MRCYVNSMQLLRRVIMLTFKVFLQLRRRLIRLFLRIWRILLNVVRVLIIWEVYLMGLEKIVALARARPGKK
jgi:hypothetical protein